MEEKIEGMLLSEDPDMQQLGITLFHEIIPSVWQYKNDYHSDYLYSNLEMTRARMRLYKRRRDIYEKSRNPNYDRNRKNSENAE